MRAIIVGSGIGGLSATLALRRVGIEVTLYERAPELTEVGAGISLWANALRALDHIGAGQAVRAAALPMERSEFWVRDGYLVAASYSAADIENGDLAHNLAAFVAERHPRTASVTRTSWRFGRLGQWQGRLPCWLRDRLFGLVLPLAGPRGLLGYATFDVGPLPAARPAAAS
jgi:2-polyprenyl-6-methoxyphenol hydroxylase-like FAD-dependent oxidoreductase